MNARLALADIDPGRGTSKLSVAMWARNLFDKAYVYRRDPSNSIPSFGNGTAGNISDVLGDCGNFNASRTSGGEMSFSS